MNELDDAIRAQLAKDCPGETVTAWVLIIETMDAQDVLHLKDAVDSGIPSWRRDGMLMAATLAGSAAYTIEGETEEG